MTTKQKDSVLAAALASPNPQALANVLGKPGRTVRNYMRTTLGVYVTRGGVFDDACKGVVYAHFTGAENAQELEEAFLKAK